MNKKPKYKVGCIGPDVINADKWICTATSDAMARKIARALNAMEAKPKAKPFAFDWSRVPERYKWAAMDSDREWAVFLNKPRCANVVWNASRNDDLEFSNLGYDRPPYPGDWRDSLQERPSK
jgi:hypothetical protein